MTRGIEIKCLHWLESWILRMHLKSWLRLFLARWHILVKNWGDAYGVNSKIIKFAGDKLFAWSSGVLYSIYLLVLFICLDSSPLSWLTCHKVNAQGGRCSREVEEQSYTQEREPSKLARKVLSQGLKPEPMDKSAMLNHRAVPCSLS